MTLTLAREVLTIFVEGDEVPGLIAYGLAPPEVWRDVKFPADAWSSTPSGTVHLYGETWDVHGWEFPIAIWPTGCDFQVSVYRTLERLVHGGSRVAWIGAEGLPFCDPPGLFDPDSMSGGVLAWMTDDGRFACPLDPNLELVSVSDDELLLLRSHAFGLADG